MVVLKPGEKGRWKGKRCAMKQKSSVDLQEAGKEDGFDDDIVTEDDVAETELSERRGNPPHKLLAGKIEKLPHKLPAGLSENPPHKLLSGYEVGVRSGNEISVWADRGDDGWG